MKGAILFEGVLLAPGSRAFELHQSRDPKDRSALKAHVKRLVEEEDRRCAVSWVKTSGNYIASLDAAMKYATLNQSGIAGWNKLFRIGLAVHGLRLSPELETGEVYPDGFACYAPVAAPDDSQDYWRLATFIVWRN